jgi:hypothetical protein
MAPPVFIHVGFSNSGTTSLQRNFFARRDDIFYAGEPYGERGGIFSMIKSVEDFNLDAVGIEQLCEKSIHRKSNGRPIVVSDETLCETPQLYFAPYTMPRDAVALRLQRLFPAAKIIFTIRDQRHYIESMYLNLKRNAAFFDRMSIAPFSQWLAGTLALPRGHYLQNLDFLDCIGLYTELFGRENICVLPLEMAVSDGVASYLGRLCGFMGLDLREADVANYVPVHNRRMSVHGELVADLLADERFGQLYGDLSAAFGSQRLAEVLDAAPRSELAMAPADEAKVRERVGVGNWLLAQEYDLDLQRYGYPLANDAAAGRHQIGLARQQYAFEREIAALRNGADTDAEIARRRRAEISALRRQLRDVVSQLDHVSASPVWRVVRLIENGRQRLRRAAAMGPALASGLRRLRPAAPPAPGD